DCAHAHGSFYKDKALGSIGDIGTFSFQAIKTMTAGEGGMIVTSSKKLYEKAYSYFNCGRNVFGNPYEHKSIASNYRMSEI
ncbi:DegT/DnrJ/EryC1/StrS family aminotransferase, partial [Salmonella enterica]|nr:DegT/DnrJ/EryC1/StrS family aminotransferase [Salmonella enterica]